MSKRMWRINQPLVDVQGKRGFFDVAYGAQSEKQKLDIWLPATGDGPFPVIIAIHGGGFLWCDKRTGDMITPMLAGLTRGYAIVSVNYRLLDESPFPAQPQDLKMAIRYLRAHAPEYLLDAGRMVTWGGSAGGYLTLMSTVFENVALFDTPEDPNLDVSAKIAGAVAWYAGGNMAATEHQLRTNSILRQFLWQDTTDVSEEYCPATPEMEENEFPFTAGDTNGNIGSFLTGDYAKPENFHLSDPSTYINKEMPRILLQHGTRDEIVPMQQSIDFSMKVNDLFGYPHTTQGHAVLELIPEAIHSSVLFETPENINRVFLFLEQVLA